MEPWVERQMSVGAIVYIELHRLSGSWTCCIIVISTTPYQLNDSPAV